MVANSRRRYVILFFLPLSGNIKRFILFIFYRYIIFLVLSPALHHHHHPPPSSKILLLLLQVDDAQHADHTRHHEKRKGNVEF